MRWLGTLHDILVELIAPPRLSTEVKRPNLGIELIPFRPVRHDARIDFN